ncbi:MAG: leucine-rich repeat domain-containing protein [Muribaculaceae bacterium]|nr:leucine-rich repeat domain-containing protein [Muribaculaceae bacterium]
MNIIAKSFLAAALCAAPLFAAAESVTVSQPGSLAQAVTDKNASSLSVEGSVNAADLYWVAAEMPQLSALDLSKAVIAPYSGKMLRGRTQYAAGTIPASAFLGSKLTSVVLPEADGTLLGESCFAGTDIESIAFPAGIKAVGFAAFAGCPKLKEVTVPAAEIGAYAFAACPALAKADLAAASVVADGSFADCTALSEVLNTQNLTAIGAKAFAGCSALASFTFGKDLTSVGNAAFERTALTAADLTAASGLRRIGDWAFAHDAALTSVALPADAALKLGKGSFFDSNAITAISLPDGITALPDYVLKGVSAADGHAVLPAAVDSIGDYALKDNRAVAALTLPAALSHIGTGAMEGMTGLASIDATAPQAVPSLGSDVWKGVDQSKVNLKVYDYDEAAYRAAPQWQNFMFDIQTGVNDVVNPDDASAVQGRFIGTDLQVRSAGAEMASVSVFTVSGVLLVSVEPQADEITIDTAGFTGRVFLVSVVLADGSKCSIKLARN